MRTAVHAPLIILAAAALLVGCEQRSAEPAASQPAGAKPTQRPAQPTTLPGSVAPSQDDLDDPDAPPFLPKSNVVGTWVKHRAVRVAIPGELKQLFARDASALEDFRVKLAASCVYRRIVNDQAELAYVELVQTHQPDDAFGILTVQSTGSETLHIAGLTRVDTTNGYHLHCWKGRYYVHVYGFVTDDPTFLKALQDLARRITFEMPAASQPRLIEMLPDEQRVPHKLWLVRSARSLAVADAAEVPCGDANQVDEILGLNKDVLLLVAAYQQPGLAGLNYVWLARYPTPAEAQQAFKRYQHAIDQAKPQSPLANTLLTGPHGAILAGTWTADRESLMHVLPELTPRLTP